MESVSSPRLLPVEDPYQNIQDVPEDVLESLAVALEARAQEAAVTGLQRKVLGAALQGLCGGSSGGAVVVDVGCGTGAVTRAIAGLPGVSKVIGIDPSPFFLAKARAACSSDSCVEYCEGVSTDLPLPDGSADLVVFIHVFTHLPLDLHMSSLAEARRVIKEGGRILLKDSDLCSWSLTLGPTDPLTPPVETLLGAWSSTRYLCRMFPSMLESAGFAADKLTVHNVLNDTEDTYGFKYVLLRSIKMFYTTGNCSRELADALVAEAKRRVRDKKFQCLLSYGACIGYKYASRT